MDVELAITRYRLLFETAGDVRLPRFPGALWQGALGSALRRRVCTTGLPVCDGCPRLAECAYPLLFEAQRLFAGSAAPPPRPLVLEPGVDHGHLPPGRIINLDIVLIGTATRHAQAVLSALSEAARVGLGRSRMRVMLVDIQHEGLNAGGWQSILDGAGHIACHPIERVQIPPPPDGALLEFITPVRLRSRGQLVTPRSFTLSGLVHSIQGRVERLCLSYGSHDDAQSPGIGGRHVSLGPLSNGEHSDELAATRQHLTWQVWQRCSTKTQTETRLGGLMGILELSGDTLAKVWPSLWLGQWIHVGTEANLGFGAYQIEALPEPAADCPPSLFRSGPVEA